MCLLHPGGFCMSFLLFAESETVAAGDGAAPVAVCTGDPAADAGRALLGAASEAARAGVYPAVCVVLSRAVAERALLQPIAAAGVAGAEGGAVALLPDVAVGFPGGGLFVAVGVADADTAGKQGGKQCRKEHRSSAAAQLQSRSLHGRCPPWCMKGTTACPCRQRRGQSRSRRRP